MILRDNQAHLKIAGKYSDPVWDTIMSQVIYCDISDISEWFYVKNSKEIWYLQKDFPVLMSPWPIVWFEWDAPTVSNHDGVIVPHVAGQEFFRIGALVVCIPKVDVLEHNLFRNYLDIPDDFSYVQVASPFCEGKFSGLPSIPGVCAGSIMSLPKIYCVLNETGGFIPTSGVAVYTTEEQRESMDEFIERGVVDTNVNNQFAEESISVSYPMFFSISLLHCSNVTTHTTNNIEVNRKRRTGEWKYTIKTLEIHAFKRTCSNVSRATGQNEQSVAMHLCRGHFKNFTGGAGLFGKYHGMWWWESSVRGSARKGKIMKDYRVVP